MPTSLETQLSSASSPLRHAGFDAARAAQSWQRVLPVCPVPGAAQAHVDGLAAGVHAADRGESHAARSAVSTQRAFSALGRGAAEGGAPRQAVGGAGGGVDWAGAGGLWSRKKVFNGRNIFILSVKFAACVFY